MYGWADRLICLYNLFKFRGGRRSLAVGAVFDDVGTSTIVAGMATLFVSAHPSNSHVITYTVKHCTQSKNTFYHLIINRLCGCLMTGPVCPFWVRFSLE